MLDKIYRYLFTWDPIRTYITTKAGSPLITRVFWIVFTVAAIGVLLLGAFTGGRGSRGWGPEGPVGGWLLLIPPIGMTILAALVLLTNSDSVKLFAILILGLPMLQIGLSLIYEALKK